MKKSDLVICLISLITTLSALLMMNYLNNTNYNTSLSDINIMNTNYKDSRDYILDNYYIFNYEEKEDKLKEVFNSAAVTPRLKYRASLISHLGEEEIVINGINIKNDEHVFNILKDNTLENFDPDNSIVISKSIASILDVNTNDTIILKLITKTGHYNAEEYTIIEISDKLNYNYALIDINNLNNFAGLENAATEIYVKSRIKKEENLKKYSGKIKEILGDDFDLYSKKDILGNDYDINKDNDKFNIYVLLTYLFALFAVFIFINSYTVYDYKKSLKNQILFSLIGFTVSFLIYIWVIKFYYQKDIIFSYTYPAILIINLISAISANIKYSILEKLFIKKEENYKKKNILISAGIGFTYIIAFILLYSAFLGFTENNSDDDIKNENIIRIVKNNTSENTFLFNGSIDSPDALSNKNIINKIFKDINHFDKYADIERVISFPVGVVIRTGSIGSRVYTYENNILENGVSVSNIIKEGEIFESNKREIIIGKDLADYLNLKIGDALSLIAKASRGWLETGYFYVSGIYDLKEKNYDIIGDISAMNSFIYLKEGNKSPYNESIIVFSDNDNIYSYLSNNDLIDEYNLKIVSADKEYYTKHGTSIKNIIFIIVIAFTLSMICSSVLSIFYRRLSQFIDPWKRWLLINTSYAISLLISVIISSIIIFIFLPFSFKFLAFTISILLLSFLLSVLISNNKVNNAEEDEGE